MSDSVSLEEFISMAKMQLEIETTNNDSWFEALADQAIRSLDGVYSTVKEVAELSIVNNRAILPCGCVRLIALRVNCEEAIYANLDYLWNCGCNAKNITSGRDFYEIVKNTIWFHNVPSSATKVHIAFLKLLFRK